MNKNILTVVLITLLAQVTTKAANPEADPEFKNKTEDAEECRLNELYYLAQVNAQTNSLLGKNPEDKKADAQPAAQIDEKHLKKLTRQFLALKSALLADPSFTPAKFASPTVFNDQYMDILGMEKDPNRKAILLTSSNQVMKAEVEARKIKYNMCLFKQDKLEITQEHKITAEEILEQHAQYTYTKPNRKDLPNWEQKKDRRGNVYWKETPTSIERRCIYLAKIKCEENEAREKEKKARDCQARDMARFKEFIRKNTPTQPSDKKDVVEKDAKSF